jgi:glyoxylate/hydroxypyruvate reductase A
VAILLYSPNDDLLAWRRELLARRPDLDVRIWPETGDPAQVTMALVWLPPPGMLAGLPNLGLILSLGAGVDAMLRDTTLPDLPLCRMIDPALTRSMSEFVLLHVLKYHRQLDLYALQQRRGEWSFYLALPASERRVGIMGLGVLGEDAGRLLARHGLKVSGWSRTSKTIEGIASFAGEKELDAFLGELDILVCLLPLTAETDSILGTKLFARLPRGARLINVARGQHLVEQDLIDALDTGQLAHATLDVMRTEPLPPEHPFWRHPRIDLTPHVASYSLPESGVEIVIENIRRFGAGEPLLHVVDRGRGY